LTYTILPNFFIFAILKNFLQCQSIMRRAGVENSNKSTFEMTAMK